MSRSRPNLAGLFGGPGVSPKYRAHRVGLGLPVEGYHDMSEGKRAQVLMSQGQKLKGYADVKGKQFDLTKPDDLTEYLAIRDKIANRLYAQIDRITWQDPANGNLKIYLEWAVLVYKPPVQLDGGGSAPVRPRT